jgi:hypothetical protein
LGLACLAIKRRVQIAGSPPEMAGGGYFDLFAAEIQNFNKAQLPVSQA